MLQAFDSRLFGLGGSQSNRFVPLLSADISPTMNGKKKNGARALPRQNGTTPGFPPRPPTAPPQVWQLLHNLQGVALLSKSVSFCIAQQVSASGLLSKCACSYLREPSLGYLFATLWSLSQLGKPSLFGFPLVGSTLSHTNTSSTPPAILQQV